MEQLRERSRAGRKETNRKLSTGTGKERMGDQAGENGENRRNESESGALRKPLRGGDRKKGKGRTGGQVAGSGEEADERKRTGSGKDRKRKHKVSTRGTAVGAKRGRVKGNKQEAEYENLEGRHERSGRRERGNRGSESGDGHRESS